MIPGRFSYRLFNPFSESNVHVRQILTSKVDLRLRYFWIFQIGKPFDSHDLYKNVLELEGLIKLI